MPSFVHAGFRAVTTLAFVAPTLILPPLMDQLHHDLDPKELETIGLHEYSIWKTPEGTLFVDGELFLFQGKIMSHNIQSPCKEEGQPGGERQRFGAPQVGSRIA